MRAGREARADEGVDTMVGEPHELALEKGLVDDRQEWLRRRERQRPEARPLSPDEDDGLPRPQPAVRTERHQQ